MSKKISTSFKHSTPLTSQSERDNCDLNILVRRFGVVQVAASHPFDPSQYGEWDSTLDLRAAVESVQNAQTAFNQLPATIREKFQNDPRQLLAALKDPDQADQLRELGVLKPKPEQPVAVSDPPSPKAKANPSGGAARPNEGTAEEAGTGGKAP